MNPQFPLYVVSKGRAESRLTSKALERANIPYSIVIEEAEYDDYSAVIDPAKILILDPKYQDVYEPLDDLGRTKSLGPGPARNFVWDHANDRGYAWHWVMDDNIRQWFRMNHNKQFGLGDGTLWRACEDWVLRYKNIGMAGPNYDMFVPRRAPKPPLTLNTRIYSCNLVRNDAPFRWRGRYNEDTILSLDMLEGGWCTVLFNGFLQKKIATQYMTGGNTREFYAHEGTYPKTAMLVREYPKYARIVSRWGRIHHKVDYSSFGHNYLRRKPDIEIPKGINEYGMQIVTAGKSDRKAALQK